MRRVRVIPVLLLDDNRVVKTQKFGKKTYIGDPINAVKIFNDKEVDEIVVLDISASKNKLQPNLDRIHTIVGEAFMPVAYGGGICNVEQIAEILKRGVEKAVVNTAALTDTTFLTNAANRFGSQSIVASVDYKKDIFGRNRVYDHAKNRMTRIDLFAHVKSLEAAGVGEIILNSVSRDGTFGGYDIKTLRQITESVDIPVIACGGASSIDDLFLAISDGGASAVAAGSLFVLQKPHRAVLISFFDQKSLSEGIFERL